LIICLQAAKLRERTGTDTRMAWTPWRRLSQSDARQQPAETDNLNFTFCELIYVLLCITVGV